jgi:hypothetical protein
MPKRTPKKYVLSVSSTGHEVSLDVWKVYRQLEDDWAAEHDMVRVIDNTNEDYLFPARFFTPIELEPTVERRIKAAARSDARRRRSQAS